MNRRRRGNALWREIGKQLEQAPLVEKDGPVFMWKRSDPSIADQISQRMVGLSIEERYALLLKAQATAPGASSGTQRKWRRRLGLDR